MTGEARFSSVAETSAVRSAGRSTLFSSEFLLALADDLSQIARLHGRELDADCIAALQESRFPENLAFRIDDTALATGLAEAVAKLSPVAQELDLLAADYAGIYLTGAYGASPYESVWVTDEHLTCEWPMFELRRLYAAAGLQVADSKAFYDDHLVLQLQFHEHRLRQAAVAGGEADWKELADELDKHILYWLPDFCARVVNGCHCEFYALLSAYTGVWLDNWRNLLAVTAAAPRPEREAIKAYLDRRTAMERGELAPVKFFPGSSGPSW